MKAREIKEKRKQMIKEASETNPIMHQARNIMVTMSIILVILRAIHIIFEVRVGIVAGVYNYMVQNIVITIILIGFLYTIIANGTKALTVLPLLGSIFSMITFLSENWNYIVPIFQEGDLFFMLYTVVCIVSILMQGITMIVFLAHPKCKAYFGIYENIYRELNAQYMSPKL